MALICISLCNLKAQTDSIVDSAANSPEVRHQLVAKYETSTNEVRNDQLLATAVSYAIEGNFKKAEPVYKQYLAGNPDNVRALRGLGQCYLSQRHFDEAITCFKKSLALGDNTSLRMLAVSYLNSGRYSEMEPIVPALAQQKTTDNYIPFYLIEYASSKDPPDEELISEALDAIPDQQILPDDNDARIIEKAIKRLYTPELNNETRKSILRKIIRGYEANTNAWPKRNLLAVAEAYNGLLRFSEAEVFYKRVLENYPQEGNALLGLGISELYQHRPIEAIDHLRKAWKHGLPDALPQLGAAYLMTGKLDGLKDLIPDILAHKTENMENLNTLLAYCINVQPHDEQLFHKAIEGFTDDQLLRRDDTASAVIMCFKMFGDQKEAARLSKLKSKQDKGAAG